MDSRPYFTRKTDKITLVKIIYPFPWILLSKIILAALTGHSLSFRKEADACISKLNPALEIHGAENLPAQGGYVILVNHYYRPWFRAWWIALAVASVVPREMHWTMAAAWTYPDKLYGKLLENISRILFKKVARVFHFTNMPPMPPRPLEVYERAQSVREILRLIHDDPCTILGLAPEGGDNLDGKLHLPPPGAGRFIYHLQQSGLKLIPTAIYETDRLCLCFGAPIKLYPSHNNSPANLDREYRLQVYSAIADMLPENNISTCPYIE